MLFFLFLCLGQEVKTDKTSAVLPFMKIETVGVSPINESEKIFYKRNAADKIMKEFKETPVFIVRYEKKGDKTISRFEQAGIASCVFFTDDNKWLSASIDIKMPIPEGYVLRAHTVSSKNEVNLDRILEVQEASIVQFYLKPVEMAVKFK